MREKIWAAILLAGIAAPLAAVVAGAQTEDQKQPFTLKENVYLVVVPVTVKDRDGRLMQNLTRDDFTILEDGKQKSIQYFSNEMTPVSALVLVDTGMPAKSFALVRDRLRSLSNAFGPSDEVALYFFDKHIRLGQDFTPKTETLLAAFERESVQQRGEGEALGIPGGPFGGSPTINGISVDSPGKGPTLSAPISKSINDALYEAAEQLRYRPEGRRRMVLLISDGAGGRDTFSYHEMMTALEVAKVTVYAVSLGSGWAAKRRDFLARVVRDTGGDISYVHRQSGLDAAYFTLTNEARNSYVLGFNPSAADGKFHDIDVRVARKGVKWIARDRFFAPPLK